MFLEKWDPFREIDKLFTSSFTNVSSLAMDVYENEEEFVVEADVPGMGPQDIEITLDENVLTIKGKREIQRENNRNYWCFERPSKSFSRSITLPSSVDCNKIQANYDKGVLKISIMKMPREHPKKIDISTT
jgi:HSP20 family protein